MFRNVSEKALHCFYLYIYKIEVNVIVVVESIGMAEDAVYGEVRGGMKSAKFIISFIIDVN